MLDTYEQLHALMLEADLPSPAPDAEQEKRKADALRQQFVSAIEKATHHE